MACVLFGLISISACTSNILLKQEYPEYFSQIIKKSGKCADISGKYEFSSVSLTDALNIKEGVFNTIEIHSDENLMQIIVIYDDKEVRKSLSLDSGDLKCYGDGILLYEKTRPHSSLTRIAIVYPAVDGALLLWRGSLASAVGDWRPYIPNLLMDIHTGYWIRYEPVVD
jgi:hypothetical protein